MSLGRTLYRTATRAAYPFLGMLISHRVRQGKEEGERTAERFARPPSRLNTSGPLVWLHGASIGETQLLIALAERMAALRPDLSYVLTSQTRTSADLVARAFARSPALKTRAAHQYAPIDSPGIAARFIAHWTPCLAVFSEGEIWPNLLSEARKAGVATALINARMTDKTIEGWQKWAGFAAEVFSPFDVILAADERTAAGMSDLSGKAVYTPGNLKSSLPPPGFDADELARLKHDFVGTRPCLTAVSTHAGEEAFVLDALAAMETPPACVIVPRHPERGDEIAALLESRKLPFARRSPSQPAGHDTAVLLADTLGEVGLFARLADTVYLGGGQARGIGGHNPVEILQTGTPVLTGPDLFNFADIVAKLSGFEGFSVVTTPQELASAFPAPPVSAPMKEFLEAHADAPMQATLEALIPLLPEAVR